MKTVRIRKVVKAVEAPTGKSTMLNPGLQASKKVKIRRIPEDIKKAKRIFKVDKEYKIQEPPKNHLNTEMGVYLKGDDGKLYVVGFPYFIRVAN